MFVTILTKRSSKQFTSYYSYECFALIFSPTPFWLDLSTGQLTSYGHLTQLRSKWIHPEGQMRSRFGKSPFSKGGFPKFQMRMHSYESPPPQ